MANIGEILKIQSQSLFHYQISQVYYVSLGKLPIIYTKLYSDKKISLNEYRLIKRIWNSSNFCINEQLLDLLKWFFGSNNISKSQRNSFNSSINKMTKYGLVTCKKDGFKIITIELSTVIFSKIQSYYNRYLRNVDLFYLVYLKEISRDQFLKYLDLCKEEEVEPLEMSNKIEHIYRVPLIGIRSPILGLREPVVGIRKPIINHKNNEYIPNKRRKINFNAKKYDGLTENEKRQLASYARFGSDYVERKLRQMQRKQYSNLDKMEIDCIDNFVPYYENLVCKATGRLYYNLLKNHKKKLSRHWTSIFKCYKMCIDKGYDWKIYLEAQFESFKNWDNVSNFRYPVPNMLCTDRAINAYENYVYHNETAYKNEGWETKLTSRDIGNYIEEVEKIIEIDLGIINNVIKYSLKKSFNKTFKDVDKSRKDLNKLYYSKAVQQSWEDLSVEFWTFIPQMNEFIDCMYGKYTSFDAKIDLYRDLIDNSKKVGIIYELCISKSIPMLYGIIEVDEKMK